MPSSDSNPPVLYQIYANGYDCHGLPLPTNEGVDESSNFPSWQLDAVPGNCADHPGRGSPFLSLDGLNSTQPTASHMNDSPLFEDFSQPSLSPRLSWRCEPANWRVDNCAKCLRLNPDSGTDFWQRTHYGFEVDNGHFLFLEAGGDFVLTTKVTSNPVHQYDQAGLMVRLSSACWLKTSVEFEPLGSSRLGAVVTNGQYSDWSTQPIAAEQRTVWFRVRAEDSDYIVESSFEGQKWEQIRMARLLERSAMNSVSCGLYACSPKAAGYEAEFSYLSFEAGRLR